MSIKRLFFAAILLLSIACQPFGVRVAHAQQVSVEAGVDRNSIPINQTVNLTVNIAGGSNASQPSLPSIDGMQIEGSSRSSQFSFNGSQAVSELSFTYMLRPTREGIITIPPITVDVDGTTYATAPIPVEVTPAVSNNATDGQELFVEAEVDNPTPYLGQQITYIFRFYQAVNLSSTPKYTGPSFSGFWNKEQASQSQSNTQINDLVYRVTELRTILFPTVPGEQTIEPSQLSIPNSIFQSGFDLQTDPVVLNVQTLPQPMPDNFSGTVGQLTVALDAQTESGNNSQPLTVELNEAVTLRITVDGAANFDTLQDIAPPELDGWRTFDSTTSTDSRVANGQLIGRRTIEQLIVPTQPGQYEIPPLEYIYFDPEAVQYQTQRTAPIQINVQGELDPGANAQPAPLTEFDRATGAVERIDADIRHIKPAPATLEANSHPLTQRPLFWAMWALPLILVVGDWAAARRAHIINADPVAARRSRALREAQRHLQRARSDAANPYSSCKEILTEYLSNKLNRPVAGLTQHGLAQALTDQKLPPDLIQETQALLALGDMGQYAPMSSGLEQPADLLDGTEALLKQLEESIRHGHEEGQPS